MPVFLFLGYKTFTRNNQWNDRSAFYEAHRAEFPNEARVLASLASSYAVKGEVRKAIGANLEARKNLNSLNAFYYKFGVMVTDLNLATLYTETGDNAKAREEALRVLSVEPNQELALGILFRQEYQADNMEAARRVLQRLITLKPNDLDLRMSMREVLERLNDTAEIPRLDVSIAEMKAKREAARKEAIVFKETKRPTYINYVLFATTFIGMWIAIFVFVILKRHGGEIVRWIQTGSTVSVDSLGANLQDL